MIMETAEHLAAAQAADELTAAHQCHNGGRVMLFTAPVTCPDCEHMFTATWEDRAKKELTCPCCRNTFTEAWPGFTFTPETYIASDADTSP